MIINPSNRISSVEEYYFSRKLKEIAAMSASGEPVINLGIGSPDLPPHIKVINTLQSAANAGDAHAYQSYRGLPELREAFGRFYRRHYSVNIDPATEILPMIGSKEAILHLSMALLNPGDEVLIPNPGYPTYAGAARLAGARVRAYPLDPAHDWRPDFQQLSQENLEHVKLMWLSYPHMPTGVAGSLELLNTYVEWAREHNIFLCHDNPYSFILTDTPVSILALPDALEHACELNSLSKSHNMAGWRVGALLGHRDLIAQVLKFKSNMDSGMFKAVQLAAIAAMDLEDDWYSELNTLYRLRKKAALRLLSNLGCKLSGSEAGMFLWARVPEQWQDGNAFSEHLLKQCRVFITPGFIFGSAGQRYVRLSLCNDIQTFEHAIDRLAVVRPSEVL